MNIDDLKKSARNDIDGTIGWFDRRAHDQSGQVLAPSYMVTVLTDRIRELEDVLRESRDTIEELLGFVMPTYHDDAVLDRIKALLKGDSE